MKGQEGLCLLVSILFGICWYFTLGAALGYEWSNENKTIWVEESNFTTGDEKDDGEEYAGLGLILD